MRFLNCLIYLALTGAAGFLLGRVLPKRLIRPDRGLFRCFAFEKDGRIYEKLGIRFWQSKVPDMSRILPFMMPPKSLNGDFDRRLPLMIKETCIAELIHLLLCLSGLYCLRLWPGTGGALLAAANIFLFNLPFVLIQRYNRPRLRRLAYKLERKSRLREDSQ